MTRRADWAARPGLRFALLTVGLAALMTLGFLGLSVSSAGACGQAGDAGSQIPPKVVDNGDGSETRTYFCGPITVTEGQNRILFPRMKAHEKPNRNGWITSLDPDLVAVDDQGELFVPTSDQVMFHHGVWINNGVVRNGVGDKMDSTSGGGERFYATGEEKTQLRLPYGYGYFYRSNETWILNHMIHNLVTTEFTMYIVWKINFIPDDSPESQPGDSDLAKIMKPVRPIWMDIDNGSHYPIFDTWRGDGGRDGQFTFPDDTYGKQNCPARSAEIGISTYSSRCYPYGEEPTRNRWTVDRDGYIVFSVGHVHSGGLWTDLNVIREGASYEGPSCESELAALNRVNGKLAAAGNRFRTLRKKAARIPNSRKARKAAARRAVTRAGARRNTLFAQQSVARNGFDNCRVDQPRVDSDYLTPNKRARIFRSDARYFDPARRKGKKGRPVSWDMAMHNTTPDFRAQLRAGDVLETNTTYETKIGSWFESMGIHISYMADGQGGENPFETRLDNLKGLNHGPLEENEIHGGDPVRGAVDPADLPNGPSPTGELLINGYTFGGGDFFRLPRDPLGRPLVVRKGQSLRFRLPRNGPDWKKELWHSLTACKAPCNRSTGIAYPLPNGEPMFDSGQLGQASLRSGANDEEVWETPSNLPVGTHTFYCRIHPLMRGAIRVVPR